MWGEPAEAARANTDTFQVHERGAAGVGVQPVGELWLGLEDHVLEHARVHELKLSVFTGPVLADDDPPYRGIRIPLKFWKIAAWSTGDALATTGFVVDQSPLIDTTSSPARSARRRRSGRSGPSRCGSPTSRR